MIIAKAIVFGVSSLAMLLSPLFSRRPKVQYNVCFVSSILIVGSGVDLGEALLNTSWLLSFVLTIVYLILMLSLTKALSPKLIKSN